MGDQQNDLAGLVLAARGGDRQAQGALFRRFLPVALRSALALTKGRRAEAEDLVQEAFVTCFQRLGELEVPAQFPGWLLKTIKNRGINRLVQDKNRLRILGNMAVDERDPSPDPFEEHSKKELLELVRGTVATLEDGPVTETAKLYYFDGIEDLAELASRLGVPKSTVTTRLDRFRQLLRKRLLKTLVLGTAGGAP